MSCIIFRNLTLTAILHRYPRNLQHYISLAKNQGASINRNNDDIKQVNFDTNTMRNNLIYYQAMLLTEIYFLLYLEEFIQYVRVVFHDTFCRIHHVLTIGMIAENWNHPAPSKDFMADETRRWFLNGLNNAGFHRLSNSCR